MRATTSSQRKKARRTGGKSQLLELSFEPLHAVGFTIYEHWSAYQRVKQRPERCIIKGYPHESLYGTPGKKEALIIAPADDAQWNEDATAFLPDEDGLLRLLLEAKYQNVSGSVDEKLPYVWMAFLCSPIRNWILVYDGIYWREGRGKAAIKWLRGQAAERERAQADRRLVVVSRSECRELLNRIWGMKHEVSTGS